MVKIGNQQEFKQSWRGSLSDYVTAVVWLPDGQTLAASSATGEVVLLDIGTLQVSVLQKGDGQSIDCLTVSPDGQFLAAGGQTGQIKIWQLRSQPSTLITTLDNPSVWVDRMAWSPTANQLAFSLGRYVQIWDAETTNVIATLNFEASSVLGMDWQPDGRYLALCGYQGARIWTAQDWDEDPEALLIPSASVAIAWSHDGNYIADGNLDNTLTVLEWENPNPWVMRGFPGKVRHLTWSEPLTRTGAPLLASCSSDAIVVWQRDADESIGWASQILNAHEGIVRAIAFQPGTKLLTSAAEDGWVCLWHNAQQLIQTLNGANQGFPASPGIPTEINWRLEDGTVSCASGQNRRMTKEE